MVICKKSYIKHVVNYKVTRVLKTRKSNVKRLLKCVFENCLNLGMYAYYMTKKRTKKSIQTLYNIGIT